MLHKHLLPENHIESNGLSGILILHLYRQRMIREGELGNRGTL